MLKNSLRLKFGSEKEAPKVTKLKLSFIPGGTDCNVLSVAIQCKNAQQFWAPWVHHHLHAILLLL